MSNNNETSIARRETGRSRTCVEPTPSHERECPSCVKGTLNDRSICGRCGIAVARGAMEASWQCWTGGGKRKPDQGEAHGYAELGAYKQDHQE